MKTKKKVQCNKNVVDIMLNGEAFITGKVIYTIPKGLSLGQKIKRIYGEQYSYQLSKN